MTTTLALLAGTTAPLVAAAGPAVAAPTANGVAAWGVFRSAEVTAPAGLTDVIAIAAGGGHNLAVRGDGTVTAWGGNDYEQATVPAGLTGVTAIAAGGGHNLALRGDGTVTAWGDNDSGQATVPAGLTDVIAVAAGGGHSLAVKDDGTVTAWGDNDSGQATVPAGLTGVTALAAGDRHSLALRDDGTVTAWGDDYYGQATVPAELTGVTTIAAGGSHSLAVRDDGTVTAWGNDSDGQSTVPVGLTDTTAVSAGRYHSLALRSDGTVAAWGYNGAGQVTVPAGLTGVTAIAAGGTQSLAVGARPAFTADAPPRTATIDAPLSYTFTVTGSTSRFELTSGTLPAGLTLTPEGVLSGTPTAAIGVPVRYLGLTASVACATSRIAQRSSPRSWSASALVWHRPTPRSPASPHRAGSPSPPAGNALVGRSTSDRDAAIDLFELRLEARRRSVVHDALARWAWSGLDADVAFHLQPRLPGDREHVVLFHYAITGLILDQLTVPVDPATAPSTTIDRLVDGLLPES